MIEEIKYSIFIADVIANYCMLFGVIWSIVKPEQRIWPPPKKWSWQYTTTWVIFYIAIILNVLLLFLDWNTWIIPNEIRFFIGIPIILIGTLFVSWGILTLGIKNTYGLKDGFILSGPYRYTRNPQYLGDIILFMGISILSNSMYVTIVHILLSLVFIFASFTEEAWLENQYGEEYNKYKSNTERFI